jgi:1-deoxy-D-xylulose 5-phosphate reductoisomerase
VVVEAFLKEQIPFLSIANINEETMRTTPSINNPVYEDFVETDKKAREVASQLVFKWR